MEIDMRVKGCPNPSCDMFKNKKHMKSGVLYCPKCGSKVVYVCAKCYKEIPDIGKDHKICEACRIKQQESKQKIQDGLKNAGQKALNFAGDAAEAAVAAAEKVVKSEVGDFAKKTVKKAAAKIKK